MVKLFEPFYTTKETGSGLGLPICYQIVEQHSGHIDVQSTSGKGSTFTIWLPMVEPPVTQSI
jgi:signal transduction histidine kinase